MLRDNFPYFLTRYPLEKYATPYSVSVKLRINSEVQSGKTKKSNDT